MRCKSLFLQITRHNSMTTIFKITMTIFNPYMSNVPRKNEVGKYNIGSHDILCDTGFPSRRILCDLHIKKLISQVI